MRGGKSLGWSRRVRGDGWKFRSDCWIRWGCHCSYSSKDVGSDGPGISSSACSSWYPSTQATQIPSFLLVPAWSFRFLCACPWGWWWICCWSVRSSSCQGCRWGCITRGWVRWTRTRTRTRSQRRGLAGVLAFYCVDSGGPTWCRGFAQWWVHREYFWTLLFWPCKRPICLILSLPRGRWATCWACFAFPPNYSRLRT